MMDKPISAYQIAEARIDPGIHPNPSLQPYAVLKWGGILRLMLPHHAHPLHPYKARVPPGDPTRGFSWFGL